MSVVNHKINSDAEQLITSLTSIYVVKDVDGQLDYISHLANDLYNSALYQLRQQLIKHHQWRDYPWLNKVFKTKFDQRENMLYNKFPYRQSAQQTLREVNDIWYAWMKASKAYAKNPNKFTGRPRMPYYLSKHKRHVFYITGQNAKINDGYLIINSRNGLINFKLQLNPDLKLKKLQRVIFKPLSKGYFKVLVQYEPDVGNLHYLLDNHKYMGIDPGLDNAFTCVINQNVQPLIINGRGVKSINQFYNKQRAKLSTDHAKYNQCFVIGQTKHGLQQFYYDSQQQRQLTTWRNQKIYEFGHQATKRIIDYALNNDVHTIVIGKNKGQKRSVNMGKKNNQNFVGIPHAKMIDMLTYKAQLHGIKVITTNESYTSQTSFFDHEKPCKQNGNYAHKQKGLKPAVRRIKRGLFKTNRGILVNADVNGALQIMRKAFPNVSFTEGILVDAVLRPVKWSPRF